MNLLPLILASLLMAAHFLRDGELVLVAISLAAPLLLLIRHVFAVRLVQLLLVIAAAEWIRTAWILAGHRLSLGQPFARMLVILGAVALFTLLAAIPLRRPTVS